MITPISIKRLAGMVATFATPDRLAMNSTVPRIIREKPIKKGKRLVIFCSGLVFIIGHYNDSASILPMVIACDSIKKP